MEKINLAQKFAAFSEHWRPKIVGELNGQEVKLVKFQGVFPWHHHEHEDEMFFVWHGRMRIEFRDRTVDLSEGEFLVVERRHEEGVVEEAEVLLFEPAATRNTGSAPESEFTAPDGARI